MEVSNQKVYTIQIEAMELLRQRIVGQRKPIPAEILQNTRDKFSNRILYCQEVRRGHFENLL